MLLKYSLFFHNKIFAFPETLVRKNICYSRYSAGSGGALRPCTRICILAKSAPLHRYTSVMCGKFSYRRVCINALLTQELPRIFRSILDVDRSRDSAVGIAGRPEGSEFESRQGDEFSLLHIVHTGSGVHPTSYKMGTGGSFPGVKRQGREADHSPPTSAKGKKKWIYTSTPLYVFMA
jgi:hypothetical protein